MLASFTPAASVVSARVAPRLPPSLRSALPVRATLLRNAADLEDQGFGLSRWTRDAEQRYREAGAEFHVYLPTGPRCSFPCGWRRRPATALVEVISAAAWFRSGGSRLTSGACSMSRCLKAETV
jgi:hypothetical protein